MRFTYNGELSGVTFIDAEHGWLPEGASIYATTDGGATWTPHDAGISTTAVSFVDDLHGYAVGEGYQNPDSPSDQRFPRMQRCSSRSSLWCCSPSFA
jgi:hypothetical protein